jgi:hypothetical protein
MIVSGMHRSELIVITLPKYLVQVGRIIQVMKGTQDISDPGTGTKAQDIRQVEGPT